MAQAAAPIDIAPRFGGSGSGSPQNQTSNLTFALRAQADAARDAHNGTPNNQQGPAQNDFLEARPSLLGRNSSISQGMGGSFYGTSGARPITMKDRGRRESTNQMGSFAGGMSWGGVSVGSWIRDE